MLDVKGWWDNLQNRQAKVVRGREIDPAKVEPPLEAKGMEAGKHYFSVTINEMFLASSGGWGDTYDPMAVVLTEFSYAGKKVAVPFVVGPSMFDQLKVSVPNGMAITDTKVAGLTPYNGGGFAVTVVLARVRRASVARSLLTFAESLAGIFPAGVALQPHLKVAGALMDSVQTLLGMKEDVQPLAGHRWEFNPGASPWLKPGYFALINRDENEIDHSALRVENGRLLAGASTGSGYRDADFILYSVNRLDVRDDVQELPFYELYSAAATQAASTDEGAWDRAKAGLVTLYQQMITSPDLTWDQARALLAEFKERLVTVHKDTQDFLTLNDGDQKADPSATASSSLRQQPNWEEKAKALSETQDLLSL